MTSVLCVMLRFLDPMPRFHGRGDDGSPEWPPSPLRLFQALVSASATRWRENQFQDLACPALQWLEAIQPSIVTPKISPESFGYRMYVPNNSGDLVTAAWARGDTETSMVKFRVEKDIRPVHLCGGDTVYYLYPFANDQATLQMHSEILKTAARSITHLGWGIDMVAGDAKEMQSEQIDDLPGERWVLSAGGGTALRVPIEGTLNDLIQRHERFLHRLDGGAFNPVPPLRAFRVVGYRRATDPLIRQFAAFSLLKSDASGYCAFDTVRRGMTVAGMMRSATKRAARLSGWNEEQIGSFVLGHAEKVGADHIPVSNRRFAYIPLPTIEFRGVRNASVVGSVRRALVAVLPEGGLEKIDWACRAISGTELIDKYENPQAILSVIPRTEKMLKHYLGPASVWSTVTPVVLPGYDDPSHCRRRLRSVTNSQEQKRLLEKLDERIESLLRKALHQAGFSRQLAAQAELQWRQGGFRPGVDLATRYGVPDHLKRFSRWHVKIVWRNVDGQIIEIPGPICIGGGRFYGLGLFAAEDR